MSEDLEEQRKSKKRSISGDGPEKKKRKIGSKKKEANENGTDSPKKQKKKSKKSKQPEENGVAKNETEMKVSSTDETAEIANEDSSAESDYTWDDVAPEKIAKEEEEPLPEGAAPFTNFRISPNTIRLLTERGFKCLFAIQAQTYDHIYDGKDLIGRARTGSGKTLSFALPVVEKLAPSSAQPPSAWGRAPKVLCLAPTRELARQIGKEFELVAPGRLKAVCIYGGAPYLPQENALRRGVDIVIGTPGRVIDMLDRGCLKLSEVRHVILDEADEMLNIGFADAIDKILAAAPNPEERQTLLFSATVPPWVTCLLFIIITQSVCSRLVNH